MGMLIETMAFIKGIHWVETDDGYKVISERRFFVPIFPDKDIVEDTYKLTTKGELYIYPGTEWDGASGPAIDTKTNMRASLVHDVLIWMVQDGQLPRDLNTKWLIDSQYMRLAREDGMFVVRRWYHFMAIQWNHWEKKIRKVLKDG